MMNSSLIQLNDLPTEIVLIILKYLSNVDVLYSLMGVNKRFNKIVHNHTFTDHLDLFRIVPKHLIEMISTSKYCILPLLDPILGRFCSEILPEIHDKIKFLNLESFSMERVLLATTYPDLFGLGLYGIEGETAIDLFSDPNLFTYSLKNQVSSLVIDMNINTNETLADDIYALLLTRIFTTFRNLRLLAVNPSPVSYLYLSINNFPSTFNSSTLVELYVGLSSFNDCLLILDGRFNQLSIFHVKIETIRCSSLLINNKEKLPNLKSFALYTVYCTNSYNELIVPLLHRMTNLERLDLSFVGYATKSFIDGNNLKQNIIYHMALLKKLTFNIRSFWFDSPMNIPSNEDIQQAFKDFKDMHIISCVDYFQKRKYSQCLVYSYPYKLQHYHEITNQFPGGLFTYVREVIYDEYPFEHEFFLRIARSFPLVEKLTLINKKKKKLIGEFKIKNKI
ncbi:unnamed protein product [Rotaria socialis]|uniref:F-box domain-containing protein n=1 Tax=Rotaria socialis TaxID=392032 RepID=A0A821F9C5_9BILA|nr:unnamed protein product [Rotaria socialis]CAF4644869.1 unnamed protein product [Rotaria socialis]